MDGFQMVVLTVFLMSFSCAAPPEPDDIEKETRYRYAFDFISRAFDWSPEEYLYPKKERVLNPVLNFGYQNFTWAVGLRGKDIFGRRYFNDTGASACMANMVHHSVAMTTCACVFSWFQHYLKNPMQPLTFVPHRLRTILDITAPFLYIHHTLHPNEQYFNDEDIRYYDIVNNPVPTPDCHAKASENQQEIALVLLEVETPVVINNIPAVMPKRIVQDVWNDAAAGSEVTGYWTLKLMSYGVRHRIPNKLLIPHDKSQIPGNNINLQEELISVRVVPAEDSVAGGAGCNETHFNYMEPGKECLRLYSTRTICHILPGSPVVTHNGYSIYGILTNEVLCDEQPHFLVRPPEAGYLQVLRLAGEFAGGYLADGKGSIVDKLLRFYNTRVEKREWQKKYAKIPQAVYNFTPGVIYYDEDFLPSVLNKIKKVAASNPSSRTRLSSLEGVIVSLIVLLCLNYYCLR